MASAEPPAGSLKRKRQILPLGNPPQQLSTTKLPMEQRSALRVNRACNTCRRQKMRCDGPDKGSPCMRCKNAGVECVFEKVQQMKGPIVPTTSRITSMEAKMEYMQATQSQMHDSIQEILYELRRRPVNSPKSTATSPLDADQVHKPPSLRKESVPPPSFSRPWTDEQADEDSQLSHLPSELVKLETPLLSIQSLLSPYSTPSDSSLSSSTRSHGANQPHSSFVKGSRTDASRRTSGSSPSGTLDSTKSDTKSSEGSDTTRPKVDDGGSDTTMVTWASNDNQPDQATGQQGRRLFARQVLREDTGRAWNPDDYIKTFGVEEESFIGERGLLSRSEAKYLFDFFFEFCHAKMPMFEPRLDTFDSLLRRSPFCLCCLLMAAVKARDGGNKPSDLQLALWDESMARAKESMFQRVRDLEVIQGLLLLSAWSESTGGTCWIVTGHAIRCGVEMGIHKALSKLASDAYGVDTEEAQILVSSARVWCALFAFEYQLSFGIGRQTMTGHPKTVKGARDTLLRHRLSNTSDIQLVSAVELLLMEYHILDTLPCTDSDDPRCQRHLQEGRVRMDAWEAEWDAVLAPKFSRGHYMRQTLPVQRNYGYMTVHMACTQRIISSADLEYATDWEKRNCLKTVSAAKNIVRIAVEEPDYRASFRYSPTCFCSGLSFAGASILRLGCILREEDKYIHHLATELGRILEDVPTCRFKASFMLLLQEKNDNKSQRP